VGLAVPESGNVRLATIADLDSLVGLEEAGFATDRFSRSLLRGLIKGPNSAVFVVDPEGAVAGYACITWRKGGRTAYLYSIVVTPALQGKGLGKLLLQRCELEGSSKALTVMRLEVRPDNPTAIAFYERNGYAHVGTSPGYYEDGADALVMEKRLDLTAAAMKLDVPYYSQTFDFTCAPACLMMAMKLFDPSVRFERSLETQIWKEATLAFMTSGLGGCEAFGVAVAGLRRGFHARVIVSSRKPPFLNSVRAHFKKEVIELVHSNLLREAHERGAGIDYRPVTLDDISDGLAAGEVPIVLISLHRMHGFKAPHWVVVTGYDGDGLFVNDPYRVPHDKLGRSPEGLRIPKAEFARMIGYGKEGLRSAVFISR